MGSSGVCGDGTRQQQAPAIPVLSVVVMAWCLVEVVGGCAGPGPSPAVREQSPRGEAACAEVREVTTAILASGSAGGDSYPRSVVAAMGRSGDPVFVPFLMEVLADADTYKAPLPDLAAEALGEIGDVAALPLLQESIATGRLSRLGAIRAMGRLAVNGGASRAAEYVMSALAHDADDAAREEAARSLRCKRVSRLLPGLERALENTAQSDTSDGVRMMAALALVRGGRKEAAGTLMEIAANPDARVRLRLVFALGVSSETLPVLLRLLSDTNTEVSGAAWEQLAKEIPSVNYASPPKSVEEGREMAEGYRNAWEATYRKGQNDDQ